MHKILTAALAIGLTFGGAMALAETSFESLDTDGNGSISKDEYYGLVSGAGVYSDVDLNSDGFIDDKEFEWIGLDDDYASWDIDQNDYLDSSEFYDGYFGYYDSNEDAHWDISDWDDAGEQGLFDL